jgi:predicted metal-dependent peptidase
MNKEKTPLPAGYREKFDETIANCFSNPKYVDYLFYAHIIGQCKIIFDTSIQAPAGVNFMYDHYNLYINPLEEIPLQPDQDGNYPKDDQGNELKSIPGFNGLSLEHRMGVMKHEMLHVINMHVSRCEDRDHQGFNIAADCAINQLIERTHLPDACIYPDQFPGHDKSNPVPSDLTAEQYYELLPFNDDQGGGGVGFSIGSGQGQESTHGYGQGQGVLDDHSKWAESKGDTELQEDISKNMLDRAISETQKSKGTIPSNISEWLDNLTKKREVDWRQVLRRLAGNKRANTRKTLMRRDRRLPDFNWIKGKTKDRIGSVVVVGDESGSVSDAELCDAIGECVHICKTLNTPIWYVPVDSQAHKPIQLKSNQTNFKRSACGGTILAPALDKIHETHIPYNALVVITDGYIDDSDVDAFASTRKPVIFLITSEGVIPDATSQYSNIRTFKLKPKAEAA